MMIERMILSQSSLQDYHDCPRRFELRYIQRLVFPAIETEPALENEKHQQEGIYFHRLVQQFLMGIPEQRIKELANTSDLKRWWNNFSSQIEDLTKLEATKPEITLSAPLGRFRLAAKYDLIGFTAEGRAVIYDWKTYRKRPKNEWLHVRWQTRVYRALLVKAGAHFNRNIPIAPKQVEMVYWFADFPSEPARFTYRTDQFDRDWEMLNRLAEEIASASSFPLTEDRMKCSFCPYRSYCDRGVRAGESMDAELEAEAEESFDLDFEQIGEIAF